MFFHLHYCQSTWLVSRVTLSLDTVSMPPVIPDLVVRVTGFTAYFCLLTLEFRKLVVDRILTA